MEESRQEPKAERGRAAFTMCIVPALVAGGVVLACDEASRPFPYTQIGLGLFALFILARVFGGAGKTPDQAQVALPEALRKSGAHREALERADEIIAANPNNAEAHYIKGECHDALGQVALADSAWARALELMPNHAGAANDLACNYMNRGDYLTAAGYFARARESGAMRIEPIAFMKNIDNMKKVLDAGAARAQEAGDFSSSRKYAEARLELDPEDRAARLRLEEIRARAADGRPDEAGLRRRWEVLVEKAREAERAEDHALTLRYQNQLIDLDPNHAISYAWRATTHVVLENFEQAIEDCRTCQRLDPEYWNVGPVLEEAEAGLNRRVAREDLEEEGASRPSSPERATQDDTTWIRSEIEVAAGAGGRRASRGPSDAPNADAALWREGDLAFGRFEIRKIDRSGGMGTVFYGWDRQGDMPVALKSIKLDGGTVHGSSEETFRGEAARWSDLGRHPRIVRLFTVERVSHHHLVLVMEYIAGVPGAGATLKDHLSSGEGAPQKQLAVREAARIASGICEAMDFAHEKERLVHRDLKPSNVFITSSGQVKVGDFGVAVEEGAPASGFAGTVEYAAPEQWVPGVRASPAMDIYAIGVMLFEMVCGRRPFEPAEDCEHAQHQVKVAIFEVLHRDCPVPDPAQLVPALSPDLVSLIRNCLAKKPGERPKSFGELRRRLAIHAGVATGSEIQGHEALLDDPGVAAFDRGVSADALGRYEKALAEYREAVTHEPFMSQRSEAWCNTAKVLGQLERFEEAEAAARRALEIDERDLHAHHILATVLTARGSHDEALERFESLIEADPRRVESYLGKGGLLLVMRDISNAAGAYRRATDLAPEHQHGWNGLGMCAEAEGDLETAVEMFSAAIEIHGAFAEAHANRARVLQALGDDVRIYRALEEARFAARCEPENPAHQLHIGLTFGRLGQFEEAAAILESAVKLNPESAQTCLALAGTYGNLGRWKEAVEFGERAARLGEPGGAELAARAERLMKAGASPQQA